MSRSTPQDDRRFILRFLNDGQAEVRQVQEWIRSSLSVYRSRLSEDIKDVEQDTLVDLLQALRANKFRGDSTLQTYVRTFVSFKCIDRMRAQRRREWVDVEDLDLTDDKPSQMERISRREDVVQALRILEALPETCREIWTLVGQGKRYSEIGLQLGISEGAARARAFRCRARALELREELTAVD